MNTNSGADDTRAQIDGLRLKNAQLTAILHSAINEDTSSLAARYIQERLKSLGIVDSYQQGREDMREQIVAYIYQRYLYFRTFFGKESEQALMIKNLIHDIR